MPALGGVFRVGDSSRAVGDDGGRLEEAARLRLWQCGAPRRSAETDTPSRAACEAPSRVPLCPHLPAHAGGRRLSTRQWTRVAGQLSGGSPEATCSSRSAQLRGLTTAAVVFPSSPYAAAVQSPQQHHAPVAVVSIALLVSASWPLPSPVSKQRPHSPAAPPSTGRHDTWRLSRCSPLIAGVAFQAR